MLYPPVDGQVLRVLQPSATDVVLGIERWGGPAALEARVERVEPGAFTKISALGVEEQRVKVVMRLDSPREAWRELGDGFRVSVRIVTSSRDNALQVPSSAVFPLAASELAGETTDGGGPRHAVFALADGRAHRVPVRLLGRNENMAWVEGRLPAGTTVVVYPPTGVRDGVRLRPRAV